MKKATIHNLLVEELTDLLYELNQVYNIFHQVDCAYPAFFHHRLMKIIFYAGFTIEYESKHTGASRKMEDVIESIFKSKEPDGYVDKADLEYSVSTVHDHISHMNLAYAGEVDNGAATLLRIIELCLTDINFYIYGEKRIRHGCRS